MGRLEDIATVIAETKVVVAFTMHKVNLVYTLDLLLRHTHLELLEGGVV